jgi:hypothetical protein
MTMSPHPPETTLISLSNEMPNVTEQRDDQREPSLLRISCLLLDDRRELCLVRNISAGGALVRTYSPVAVGRRVALELKAGESVAGVVRWCEGNMIGIMFLHQLDVVDLLANSLDWPRPRQPRVEVQLLARLEVDGGMRIGQLLDISQGGLKLRSSSRFARNQLVQVRTRDLPVLEGRVRWSQNDVHGLVFNEPLPLQMLVRWVRKQQAERLARDMAAG